MAPSALGARALAVRARLALLVRAQAMAGKPDATLVSLMKDAKAAKLNNAGGGHYNHCLCARAHLRPLPQEAPF